MLVMQQNNHTSNQINKMVDFPFGLGEYGQA